MIGLFILLLETMFDNLREDTLIKVLTICMLVVTCAGIVVVILDTLGWCTCVSVRPRNPLPALRRKVNINYLENLAEVVF